MYNLTLLPVPSASPTIFPFSLLNASLITNTMPTVRHENMSIRQNASKHTSAVAAALFSGVALSVLAAQLKIKPVGANAPGTKRKLAKYRTGLLIVEAVMMYPIMATHKGATM
ncbi:hypothetical protein K4K60_011749 [Colletotrichum sp. SAR11_57]|nr:hypothetical protein K4K60_011749 [Colletotrichum sp. SAR11_57]